MAVDRRKIDGRIIRKRICSSKTVADLIKERGPWAGLIFERLITWGDDDGRFIAEPEVVKADCLKWHPRTFNQVKADLEYMAQLELICLYQANGTLYGCFPNWREHQPTPRADRYIPSEYPPPPMQGTPLFDDKERSQRNPPDRQAGSHAGSRGDRQPGSHQAALTKPNLTEPENLALQAASLACSASPNGQHHKACMETYHEEFQKLTGEKPVITAADGKTLKQVLGRYKEGDSWQKVRAVIRYGVSHREAWIRDNPPSLRVLLSSTIFNSILGKLALDWKEKHA